MRNKLNIGDQMPSINLKDINGRRVNLKGKKTVLVFYRFVGCPVCALTMMPFTAYLKTLKDINIVYAYTSEKEKCLTAQKEAPFPENFHVISNSSKTLYQSFGLNNRSILGMIKSMIRYFPKLKKSNESLKSEGIFVDVSKFGIDGDMRIHPGDFLIDENGKIVTAHYGQDWADHISLDRIKQFAESTSKVHQFEGIDEDVS
tara:strand:+ start:287 stop:892 length:606 start_codon:yes stop_codon:yes gene_type:complete